MSDLLQMPVVSEACSLDDDMVDGDLGDGTGVRATSISSGKRSQSFTGLSETLLRRSSQTGEQVWIPGLKTPDIQQRARWTLPRCGKTHINISILCLIIS